MYGCNRFSLTSRIECLANRGRPCMGPVTKKKRRDADAAAAPIIEVAKRRRHVRAAFLQVRQSHQACRMAHGQLTRQLFEGGAPTGIRRAVGDQEMAGVAGHGATARGLRVVSRTPRHVRAQSPESIWAGKMISAACARRVGFSVANSGPPGAVFKTIIGCNAPMTIRIRGGTPDPGTRRPRRDQGRHRS